MNNDDGKFQHSKRTNSLCRRHVQLKTLEVRSRFSRILEFPNAIVRLITITFASNT